MRFIFNRGKSRSEVRQLRRIADALEDIRDILRGPQISLVPPDDSIEITSVEHKEDMRTEEEEREEEEIPETRRF